MTNQPKNVTEALADIHHTTLALELPERVYEDYTKWLHSTLNTLIDNAIATAESIKKEVPINDLRDVVMAMRDPKTLSEEELKMQEQRDASFRNKHVICAATNDAVRQFIAILTNLKK